MLHSILPNRRTAVAILLVAATSVGCGSLRHRTVWRPPDLAAPAAIQSNIHHVRFGGTNVAQAAELVYAKAHQAMVNGSADCVDYYFQAACLAWLNLEEQFSERNTMTGRSEEIYQSSLSALMSEGQRHKRFDPSRGLRVNTAAGSSTIPIVFHGFPWPPGEIHNLVPVGDYQTRDLNVSYRFRGVGVPTVAIRQRGPDEPFQRKQQRFAATCLLRPTVSDGSSPSPACVLELYDPLRVTSVVVSGRSVPIARDTSAPFVHGASTMERDYLRLFLRPDTGTSDDTGLYMLAPYQRGKIPVVFVHGLLSDRITWANMANEIFAQSDLVDQYQLWSFQYPTGEPFLQAASLLRRQLRQLRAHVDPNGTDDALGNVVLVGHSMGGLICKLQVTHSGERVWQAISKRPFHDTVMDPMTRVRLAESCFFDPSPMVSRVVFMGTPHHGSEWAQRPIGRWGSRLVVSPAAMEAVHQQLLLDNPDAFSREFTRRVPTSIDLLEPSSPLLQSISYLPVRTDVQLHSIIGQGRWMLGNGDSDGVVPVSSARLANVSSETFVQAKHSLIHQDPVAIKELLRVLRLHRLESHHVDDP